MISSLIIAVPSQSLSNHQTTNSLLSKNPKISHTLNDDDDDDEECYESERWWNIESKTFREERHKNERKRGWQMMKIYRNGYKIIWRGKLIEKWEKLFVAYAKNSTKK